MTFAEALSQLLREQNEEEQAERRTRTDGLWWHPSSLGFCDRRAVLEHAGVPAPSPDDRTLRLFWLGRKIHEALQANFPFEVIGHEVSVIDEEYHVRGRIDTVARIGTYTEAVEFKGVSDKKFGYNSLPEPSHLLQVGCYLYFNSFNEDGQRIAIDRARLVYWSKNDARVQEYIIERTEELENSVKGELKRLEDQYQAYLRDSDSLGRPRKPTEWQVRFCKYTGTGYCCGDKKETRGLPDDGNPLLLLPGTPVGDGSLRPRNRKKQLETTKGKDAGARKGGA